MKSRRCFRRGCSWVYDPSQQDGKHGGKGVGVPVELYRLFQVRRIGAFPEADERFFAQNPEISGRSTETDLQSAGKGGDRISRVGAREGVLLSSDNPDILGDDIQDSSENVYEIYVGSNIKC